MFNKKYIYGNNNGPADKANRKQEDLSAGDNQKLPSGNRGVKTTSINHCYRQSCGNSKKYQI